MLKRVSGDNIDNAVCIYEKHEHRINNNLIDKDAVKLISKIHEKGGVAYLVGGAVRDLVLGKVPKDFDIATDMTPQALKKNFRNVRIIGRRFKLAHFIYQNEKIIEVATFRSSENNESTNNLFGTIEEDVRRRDFTINALYYNPAESRLYDYVGGFEDLKNHRLISVIDINSTFKEDPVRMIRAAKYAIKDELRIDSEISDMIKRDAQLVTTISTSRLAEELSKIFVSGQTANIFIFLQQLGLLNYLLPKVSYDIKIQNPVLLSNMRYFDMIVNNFSLNKNRMVELGIFSITAHMFNNIRIYDKEQRDIVKKELMVQMKINFIHFNIANKIFENVIKMLINRTSVFIEGSEIEDNDIK